MDEKKSSTKEKNNKRIHIILLIIIIIGLVLIACLLLLSPRLKDTQEQNNMENNLIGAWTTDGYTVYVFNKSGKGALKIPNESFPFKYIIHSDKLYIDFENEKSLDLNFKFSFEGEKLILEGIKESSGVYIFNKVEE